MPSHRLQHRPIPGTLQHIFQRFNTVENLLVSQDVAHPQCVLLIESGRVQPSTATGRLYAQSLTLRTVITSRALGALLDRGSLNHRFQQGLDPCSGTLNHPAPHVCAQAREKGDPGSVLLVTRALGPLSPPAIRQWMPERFKVREGAQQRLGADEAHCRANGAQVFDVEDLPRRVLSKSQIGRFAITKPQVRDLRFARNRHYSAVSQCPECLVPRD